MQLFYVNISAQGMRAGEFVWLDPREWPSWLFEKQYVRPVMDQDVLDGFERHRPQEEPEVDFAIVSDAGTIRSLGPDPLPPHPITGRTNPLRPPTDYDERALGL